MDRGRFIGSLLGLEVGDALGATLRGSGYLVESLGAALSCFAHGASFSAAVLRAANLCDDADTTAAVCGQLAGAHYGESDIPATWLAKLALRDEIAALAVRLAR